MPKKADNPQRTPKGNKGNQTVISPGDGPISQYAASAVTRYEKRGDASPAMCDSAVASSRHFVEDNKK